MNEKTFSIGQAFKEGWELTKANLGFLIVYQLILYLLTFIFSGAYHGFTSALWHVVGWVLIILAKMGLYNSALLIGDGIKPTLGQLYNNWRQFFSWIIANFLFGFLFVLGLILLIIPGFYVLARYGLYPFLLLDKNLGPIESLEQAGTLSKGVRGKILLLFLACFGLNLLGLLLFGIGLLFTVPTTLLALTKVYRYLRDQ